MKEKTINLLPGILMILVDLALIATSVFLFASGLISNVDLPPIFQMILSLVLFLGFIFMAIGFFVLQPNESGVILLFGVYKGTVRESGWYWGNPFFTKKKVSLRVRNLNMEKLKVNDAMGNPIEIAAVVVWKVENPTQATFDVENYTDYVRIQSESALRHLAGLYPYDITDEIHKVSLRDGSDEVAEALKNELQARLAQAGVIVQEARLSHLAYAPEIAAAMLQRQQAAAIIAARTKIVEGAVGMVQMALNKLNENNIVTLDEEKKATMVSNLLVVLCSERGTQPIVNTTSDTHART